MKKALVAIDTSSVSRCLIAFAFEYALRMKVDKLDFIHVVEYRDQSVPGYVEYSIAPDTEKIKHKLSEMIKEKSYRAGIPDLPHLLIIRTGSPSEEIVKKAEEDNYDTILIGHRGMSNLERFFIGSVAAKVVRHAPCDVLVHKPEDTDQPCAG